MFNYNFLPHMNKFLSIFAIATLVAITAYATSEKSWKIASGYVVKFSTEDANGEFEEISGSINFDEQNLASSKFNIAVQVESIATGFFLKNSHARGSDWFDAEKYPTINFVSTKVEKSGDGYTVYGNLTMHGITKQIQIPFTFSSNKFTGSFSVNRMDYQIGTMEGMSKNVGNKVDLYVSVPVTR
jgi:polyisoprenoid-binding protein YceI